ncbi:FAD-dependent monooxygenase [Streptomyces sp. NPDC048611]|uniref:FAD-dependent monooxygenase n=1 Tax=Streptomyces sp. NPDC048611 TaxID=3155635 RepID=UPI0034193396
MDITNDSGHGRRALVVGLGISGIAAALRLRQAGWDPVIVEKAASRRSGGYFIALFGAGRSAARRLGILDGLTDRTPRDGANFTIDRVGNRRLGLGYTDLPGKPWMMLRGDIEQAGFDQLPADLDIRYSTVPTHIRQDADGVDVTLADTAAGTSATERFDLVVGADGLRSTVRQLAFGPHENYLRRLNYIVAAFQLNGPVSGVSPDDGTILLEPDRSMWIFPFADRPPSVLLSYRTDDVDAEFSASPAERVRAAFGHGPTGRTLGEALDALETADDLLFDSVEQVHMDRWHRGRVVLLGDAAWCVTLYAGMGASAGIAGADLLGTMLDRHPGHVGRALAEWEHALRPYVEHYQNNGTQQRRFFVPANRFQLAFRRVMTRGMRTPATSRVIRRLQARGKTARFKEMDIARA